MRRACTPKVLTASVYLHCDVEASGLSLKLTLGLFWERMLFESTFPQGLEAKGCFYCLESASKYAPGGCTGV